MRIGYACINSSLGCTASATFRLRSYSARNLLDKTAANLACLMTMLRFNADNGIGFFRMPSGLVPFASHPACRADWQGAFKDEFAAVGSFARRHSMRLSMHPDQFNVVNSPSMAIFRRTVKELSYQCEVMDLMGLGPDAKAQVHVGGAYGDKPSALARFEKRFKMLPKPVRSRLVVENDDRLFTVADCMGLHGSCGMPVVFDCFHNRLNPSVGGTAEGLALAARTWGGRHGPPMADYSTGKASGRRGSHAESLDAAHFKKYLSSTKAVDFDIMLEIKDKERSALRALALARKAGRI